MPNPLEDILKMSGSLVQRDQRMGSYRKIRKRFTQIQDVTNRDGEQGALFFLTYTVFQYIYSAV